MILNHVNSKTIVTLLQYILHCHDIEGEKCREHFSKKENSNEYVIDSVYLKIV